MVETIRSATADDLDQIMAVERAWSEDARATPDKFLARLRRFPRGFFVAEHDGRLLASITACPCRYDPGAPESFSRWATVTNDGYLKDPSEFADANALYIVSGVIVREARGGDIFERMLAAEQELACHMGLEYMVAGAVLPGYAAHRNRHGHVSAVDYALARRGSRPLDPLLARYERIGFRVRDARHVRPGYFPDAASLNYAALVVKEL